MAKRNIIKLAEKVRGHYREKKYLTAYDLDIEELAVLTDLARKDLTKAIITAFEVGIVLGSRAREKNRLPVL